MTGFIILALGKDNKKYYVKNTDPLIWSNDINECKVFEAYKYAKNDLEDNFITLSITISNSNIHSVWILEYLNNNEIGRQKFI